MPEVRIYNTLGGKVVPLRPLFPPRVSMFVCGLTPNRAPHIGHARMAVVYDVVAKFLRHQGHSVFYLQNVTDIDDKILISATEEGRNWKAVSEGNFNAYRRAVAALHVDSVNLYARCTDYIPEIIDQVRRLVEGGHAYAAEGDVYFDVASFPSFGSLSGQRLDMLEAGTKIEPNPRKRAPEDFALWKGEKLGPGWASPWGRGRPGWHIEDTAIAVNVLGPQYDIHGGGIELKFPHHEAEIAQAESVTGKSPLASIWMHNNLLNMRGEKMSKSLGNVLTLEEALQRVTPDVLRYFLLSAHYRSPLDYLGEVSLTESARSYGGLESSYVRLQEQVEENLGKESPRELKGADDALVRVYHPAEWFSMAPRVLPRDPERRRGDAVERDMIGFLADDFNVREATALLFSFAGEVNTTLSTNPRGLSEMDMAAMIRPYAFASEVLGYFGSGGHSPAQTDLASVVEVAIKCRARAKSRKDFEESDLIRDELLSIGIVLEDSQSGPKWRLRR